ncbi:hypothetical protein BLNAU_5310 [Blattamonas nauphoetae]|uniref:Uncharacterized protein n=1 Tax=Blattamonas nauphoetae TaxID=2049346 RepID=A0ABQ9Y7V3_9EUKA|nr:hypothetical protein BLNAU_5310 [Blattamonas nauphoetae]
MTGKSGKGTVNCKWTSYFCAMLGQQRHPLPPPPKPRVIVSSIFIPQPDPHFIFTTMDEEKKDLSKMTDMEHCSIDSAIKDDIDLLTRLSSAEIEQLRLMSTITAQADEHRDFVADNSDSFSGLFTGGEPEPDVFTLSSMVASVSQDSTVCVFDLTTFWSVKWIGHCPVLDWTVDLNWTLFFHLVHFTLKSFLHSISQRIDHNNTRKGEMA